MPNWKQSPPPDVLSATECRKLLQCVDRHCPSGQRDFAILRLMTDLGLRSEEIIGLCIEDIDWRAGTLVVRKNKQRRERLLPLPRLVAEAILSYLRTGRPSSSSRRLFRGRVLDVASCSLKNYATVQQSHFNGTDSQRWQLLA